MKKNQPEATTPAAAPVDELRVSIGAARNLDELAQLVEEASLESPFLGEDLVSLAERVERKVPQAAHLLDELMQSGIDLVRDLWSSVARARFRQAPRADREALMNVLRSGLLAAPISRRAVGPRVGAGELPRDVVELRSWAQRAGVEDCLDEPSYVIANRLPSHLKWAAQGMSVQAMATLSGFRTYDFPPATRAAFAQAAASYLREMEVAAREGIAEEAAFLATVESSDDPAIRALQERLRAAHARIREQRAPRAKRLVPAPQMAFHSDPPLLEYRESSGVPSGRPRSGVSAVRIDLLADDAAFLRCTCSEKPTCAHALTGLLEALASLQVPEQAERIAKAIRAPAWERLVETLGVLAKKSGDSADERLTWRIDVGPGRIVRVCPAIQKRNKKGAFSRGREVAPYHLHEPKVELTEADETALHLLQRSYADELAPRLAIAALAGHPHVYFSRDPDVRIDVREEHIALGVREKEEGSLELIAKAGDLEIPATEIHDWLEELGRGNVHIALDATRGLCRVTRVSRRAADALSIVARSRASIPTEGRAALLATLASVESQIAIDLPASLVGAAAPPDHRTILRLLPAQNGLRVEARVRPAPGGIVFEPGVGPAVVAGRDGARVVSVRRDLGAEEGHARVLLSRLGLRDDQRIATFDHLVEGPDALELVARVSPGAETFVVEWPEMEWRVLRAGPTDLRIRIEKRTDWFGVTGEIDVDGHTVALATVLAALKREERFIEIRPGMWIALEERLRRSLGEAADVIEERREGLAVDVAAIGAMEDLALDAGRFDAPAEWDAIAERLRRAEQQSALVPAGMTAELRPYQLEGFRWLARLAEWGVGGCLADDMGLGKTLQALTLLVRRAPEGPALVIAPTSVCSNWVTEAAKFAPGLRVRLYREESTEAREAVLSALGAGDVLVTSYGLVAREAERFAAKSFATLVLDEAQALKNAATQRARAVRDLSATFRVALSDTPMENHLGELWSVFRCVFPSLLGSYERFRDRFSVPIERDRNPARREALAKLVRPFLLRRTKSEVAPELPSRTEMQIDVELSLEERRLYEAERLSSIAGAEEGEAAAFDVLAAITRLRQLACHPRLRDPQSEVGSAKLERTLELIEELRNEGHRALVFSQFTKHLALVREALDERGIRYEYLDGSTRPEARDAAVRRFQASDGADLFLVSLKAGGTGLNLTAADYVIHLDPWWNPAVEDQATDRAHRIGQTRPVTVLRLVSRGTIEEKILTLHAEKRDLVAGVLEGAGAAARLSTEELLDLLRDR